MFKQPTDEYELVSGSIEALLKDDDIKPIVPRQAVSWRVGDWGADKVVELWTKGSAKTPGYHIGFIVRKQTIHGQDYQVASGLYFSGERGKPRAQRIGFLKAVLNNKCKINVF